jgi:methylated-DNA-[protein]-cysteine S-methyltransferase
MSVQFIQTPLASLWVSGTGDLISEISFEEITGVYETFPAAIKLQSELKEYFEGTRLAFDLPILFTHGTPFQQKVWQALTSIPYGETATYKEIAEQIGHPRAARAVGQASRKNPFPILLPCHRLIGSNGKLTGYFGHSEYGLNIKQQLLNLEQKQK